LQDVIIVLAILLGLERQHLGKLLQSLHHDALLNVRPNARGVIGASAELHAVRSIDIFKLSDDVLDGLSSGLHIGLLQLQCPSSSAAGHASAQRGLIEAEDRRTRDSRLVSQDGRRLAAIKVDQVGLWCFGRPRQAAAGAVAAWRSQKRRRIGLQHGRVRGRRHHHFAHGGGGGGRGLLGLLLFLARRGGQHLLPCQQGLQGVLIVVSVLVLSPLASQQASKCLTASQFRYSP
ncbi:hypothetical protein IWX91DRAFT_404812, partial [Phyllosticta citricarpa]